MRQGTRAASAGLALLALTVVNARQAWACDDARILKAEALGMSRGQVVFFMSELWQSRRCGGGSKSTASFELRFASVADVWTSRRVPISSFNSLRFHLPKGLQGAARRKAVTMARKLPGFVAAKLRQSVGCRFAGTFTNQDPSISICGKVLRYDDSGTTPELFSSLPGTPSRWSPRIASGTPAFETIRRWWPTSIPNHDRYIVGRKWMLNNVERYEIGQKTLYILIVRVSDWEYLGPLWSFSILLPVAPGAPIRAPAQGRGLAPPASP